MLQKIILIFRFDFEKKTKTKFLHDNFIYIYTKFKSLLLMDPLVTKAVKLS